MIYHEQILQNRNITNGTVVNLNIDYTHHQRTLISTPNLSSLTFNGAPFQPPCGLEGMNVKI